MVRLPGGRAGGRIAQVVEQLTLNQRVAGSSPARFTNSFAIQVTILPSTVVKTPMFAERFSTGEAAPPMSHL